MQQRIDTKKLTVLAMLCALAYLAMVVIRIQLVPFPPIKYDPKDVVIVIGGFLFGPLAAVAMSAVVSFLEMLTIPDAGGWIGFVMNVVSTCAFVCTAAIIYKRYRNLKGAVVGLVAGVLLMVVTMILWNYLLTPIFMRVPREAVVPLLVSTFLPVNLIKGGLNAAIAMLVYKPLCSALRSARLMPAPESEGATKGKINISVILLSCFVIVTCVLFILVLQGRI
ncbi:MAG: ECF transporter S component [Clostridia bacterium]|nr:ECF transporter S component [Clostridia bacterium]